MSPSKGDELLDLYDQALPEVHGYLMHRVGSRLIAEDLTSETFMAAVDSVQRDAVASVTVAWLIGIARHKLVDHWRRQERDERRLTAIAGGLVETTDPWEVVLNRSVALSTLASLAPQHQMALTLKYLDGLSTSEVASHLERTAAATEKLIERARRAFRDTYEATAGTFGEESR